MKTIENKVTGSTDVQFSGKLVSIAPEPQTNVNKNKYYPCAIDFTDKKGNTQRVRAIMYEKNRFDDKGKERVTVGEIYLCTAANTPTGVLIQVSHLAGGGGIASADMFGFEAIASKAQPQLAA